MQIIKAKVQIEKQGEKAMFMGQDTYQLDAKNRVMLPPRFRNGENGQKMEKLVLTRGVGKYVAVYPVEEWNQKLESLRTLSITDKEQRSFLLYFLSGATECFVDKQGRFVLPGHLKDFSEIQKQVVIIGVINHFQIWSKENWDITLRDAEKHVEENAKGIKL